MNQSKKREFGSDDLKEENWAPWLRETHHEIILPARQRMLSHAGLQAVQAGKASRNHILSYFSGLLWHLKDFDKHVSHLMKKRPPEISRLLEGRSEDQDGSLDSLVKPVDFFGGDSQLILKSPWSYEPHEVWVHHDALLRSCIYSTDFEWQVGTAALNIGIEALVPYMVGSLLEASHKKYQFGGENAEWLESRSGEEEIQHGENGYLLLNHYIDESDHALIEKCRFFIRALSHSMSDRLFMSLRADRNE